MANTAPADPPTDAYLKARVQEEVEAALECEDAKAAAAHVALANRYLTRLNSASERGGVRPEAS